ncbi:glutamate-5-semialdehyde dehydrogenase [Mesoterricola silvestris]|uniref:Gamma-glutamyl phosphate reductase n=1 Tax=Mesoterricola silvestris TaxID=2927979 RepID=A0AA48GKI1_9BACT|nr:glutamate-5-semialdehyde dehydrogenase [Mesoterricola silvestris]BDU74726.1 gamma-glutamyl phosphate reductase [Mesoterricola silvestris]
MSTVRHMARQARAASNLLGVASAGARDGVLRRAAAALRSACPELLEANARDLDGARALLAAGELDASAFQRLKVDAAKVEEMARGLEAVAGLRDPLGRVDLRRLLDEGLELQRVSVPLGVLAVIFESRPDAAVQIGALAIKSGNAALLKGGREAAASVRALVDILRRCLEEEGLPGDALQVLQDRADVDALLALDGDVDLVIPRGSSALVRSIKARTRIPVLGHAEGVCHLYIDAAADPAMAVALARDGKLQYPAACNATETVLLHRDCAPVILPLLARGLPGTELRGCPRCRALLPDLVPASEADWDAEYGAPILALRVVDDLDAALAHIRAHGSAHTEAIVTEDPDAAARFLREVDAAGVYHNASTRFADGYRYGFGAEVGISTSRIHARGPVGIEGLVTVKYLLRGHGQIVADYAGPGGRPFLHRDLSPGT